MGAFNLSTLTAFVKFFDNLLICLIKWIFEILSFWCVSWFINDLKTLVEIHLIRCNFLDWSEKIMTLIWPTATSFGLKGRGSFWVKNHQKIYLSNWFWCCPSCEASTLYSFLIFSSLCCFFFSFRNLTNQSPIFF